VRFHAFPKVVCIAPADSEEMPKFELLEEKPVYKR
jgi:hypothetical protein